MENSQPFVKVIQAKSTQASFLWLEGFREACCLHRVVLLCLRSRTLLMRTAQCFLLNGLIFLGSLFVLNSVVIPTLEWMLPHQCSLITDQETCPLGGILKFYYLLRLGLVQLFYVSSRDAVYIIIEERRNGSLNRMDNTHKNHTIATAGSLCPLNSSHTHAFPSSIQTKREVGRSLKRKRILSFTRLKFQLLDVTNENLSKVYLQFPILFWFYPLYIFSFILSNLWYNDIAKYGFAALGESEVTAMEPSGDDALTSQKNTNTNKPAGLGGIMVGIGEQVYSVLLLSFFFLEVYATGFLPYIGKTINFLLLSWMYAYYCYEYKWNFSEVPLDKRLDFFESNWAFFAGFGSPCVLAIFFFSPLVSYGVMAILFPLFVLTATSSGAEKAIFSQRRKWKGASLGRLPIFYVADTLSMWMLSIFLLEPQEQRQDNKEH
ncbi:protein EI24 homolog isoform X2 [Carica papaya]|uniref:protein EI24 homolog isoform X2 n=1 Tax=Carica papaya TaxID=3649 RepID=UPI000B8CF65E|nr:protein EI24 homolog isoform X2 [Carica papaya]